MALLARLLCLALLLLPASMPTAHAGQIQLAEQEIKAGLLYNFLKYTQWPPASMEKSSQVVVCIFGDDPFAGYLQPLVGRTVNLREIALRTVRAASDVPGCHLLFINAAEKESWLALAEFLKGKSVLTVSDFRGFASAGGMIEFGRRDNHISVELNMKAVTGAQLQVQDRLLKLVTVVHGR